MSQRPCGENDMQYQGSLGFLVKPRDPKSHLAMKLGLEFKYISNMVMGGASLGSMPASSTGSEAICVDIFVTTAFFRTPGKQFSGYNS